VPLLAEEKSAQIGSDLAHPPYDHGIEGGDDHPRREVGGGDDPRDLLLHPRRLYLHVQPGATRGGPGGDLLERWEAGTRKTLECRPGQPRDTALHREDPLQHIVVDDDGYAVERALDVQLHAVRTLSDGEVEGAQRILRRLPG